VTAQDLQHCADRVNAYRNSVGRPALTRSPQLESIAAAAAKNDELSHVPHQYFVSTNGGGLAMAENEFAVLLTEVRTVSNGIDFGMTNLWGEGPSGPHYQNIVGPYTQVGCGAYVNGNEVTVATDFR